MERNIFKYIDYTCSFFMILLLIVMNIRKTLTPYIFIIYGIAFLIPLFRLIKIFAEKKKKNLGIYIYYIIELIIYSILILFLLKRI
ncbi:hypothetical protein SH2C18_44860 [Clostridium sediminicola]|uniref:hypothetical protein n=1 Tax=Clostridium sediminicola TaxID=3114879 RepID=UPI0031F222D9